RAAVALGRTLETRDRSADAAYWYQKVWEDRTRHASVPQHAAHAALNLGWLCSFSGRDDEAKSWFTRAYELRAAGPEALEAARLSVASLVTLHDRVGDRAESNRLWGLLTQHGWHTISFSSTDPRLKLTLAQEKRLLAILDEWVEAGVSTQAAD